MKRIIGVFLILLTLVGCAKTSAAEASGADPLPSDAEVLLTADTVILTVDGEDVYWPEFEYYLKYIMDYYKSENGLEAISDWTATVDGLPLEDYFLDYAVSVAKNHRALEKKAAEVGAGLTDEQTLAVEKTLTEGESVYGAGEYRRMVEQSYNSLENYRYLMEIGYITDNLFLFGYGENGDRCDDEAVLNFAAAEDYMCVKFICVEDTAENRALMDELSVKLSDSGGDEAVFDRLMDEYSEYTAISSSDFPNGALFAGDYLGSAFKTAHDKLSEGEISPVCQGPEELYLILRLPLSPDGSKTEAGFTLRHCAAYALFQQDMEAWGEQLEARLSAAYYSIDIFHD